MRQRFTTPNKFMANSLIAKALIFTAGSALLFSVPAYGATDTWTGAADGGTVTNAGNWSTAALPTTTDEAVFDNSVATPSPTGTFTANQTWGDWIINSNALSNTGTSTAAFVGNATRTLTLSGGGGSSAAIANGGATGDLLLLGNNITTGTTGIASNVVLAFATSGNIDVVKGGLLLRGAVQASGQTLTKTGAGDLEFAASNSAAALVVKNGTVYSTVAGGAGSGLITLGDTTGTNSVGFSFYNAGTTFTNNFLIQAGNTGTATLGDTNHEIGGGGVSGNNIFSGNIALNNTLTLIHQRASRTTTFSGVITGSNTLQLTGSSGQLNVTGASSSSLTGTVVLVSNTGNLVIGFGQGSLGSGKIVTNSNTNTTLQWLSGNTEDISSRLQALSGSAALTLDVVGNNVTFGTANGLAGGSGSVYTINGSTGTLTLAAANSFAGTFQVASGAALLKDTNALQNASVTIGLANGILFDSSVGSHAFTFGSLAGSKGLVLADNASNGIQLTAGGNNANTAYTGTLSGAGGLTKTGSGVLTMTAPNTYTGTTSINGGKLLVNAAENAGVSGPLGNGGVITFGGGTLQYSASNTFDYSSRFSTAAGQQYSVDTNSKTVTWASALTSSGGSLTKSNTGTLILTGANTFNGGVNLNSGVLNVGVAEVAGVSGPLGQTGTIVFNGGTLQYSAANQFDYSNRFSTAGSQSFNVDTNAQTVTWGTGLVSSGGTLVKSGTGTLVLSGSGSTYNGGTTVSAGTIRMSGAGTLGNTHATLTLSGATTELDLNGTNQSVGGLFGTGTVTNINAGSFNTLTLGNADTSGSFTGFITNGTGTVAIDKEGEGTMVLGASSTYTGGTTINGGTVIDAAGTGLGVGALKFGAFSDGNLLLKDVGLTVTDLTSDPTIISANIQMLNGTATRALTVNTVNTDTYGGTLQNGSGTLSLVKSGTGTLVLTGNNTYTGATTINVGGGLMIGNGGTSGSIITTSTLTNSGNLIVNRSDTVTESTGIATTGLNGTGTFTQAGSGTTILDLANTYSGGTAITAGTLQLSGAGTLGSTTGALLDNGVFDLNSKNQSIGQLTGSGTILNSASSTLSLLTSNTAVSGTFTGVIEDNGGSGGQVALTKTGTSTLTLTGANTYTGTTTKSAGAIQLGNGGTSGSLSTSSNFTGDGTLIINRSNAVAQGVDFTATGIGGNGGFIQAGSGTTTLSSVNTYTGVTAVNAGALNVTGVTILSGNVNVANGATLMGTGNIGNTSVAAGGSIGLQNGSVGTLTVHGLTVGAAALTFDIGSSLGSIDSINDIGNLAITSGTTTISIGNATGVSTLATGTYTLIGYSGTLSGSGSLNLLTTTLDGNNLAINTATPGAVYLIVTSGGGTTGTTYTLSTVAANSRIMSGQSTAITTTVTNTGTGSADTLAYALGASGTTVSGASTTGTLAQGATGTNTLQTFSDTTAGSHTITPTGTFTNGTIGGPATQTGTTTTASVAVLNNRTVNASSVNLGRVLVGNTTGSQTTTLSSATLQDTSLTRTTLGAGAQNVSTGTGTVTLAGGSAYQYGNANDTTNSTTRSVTGVFGTAGTQSGTVSLTQSGEGLTGEAVNSIGLGYTVDAVNQRSFSGTGTLALGRFLQTSSPTGSVTVSSSGLHDVTGDATVGGFSSVNGLTLTTANATNYNGASATQTGTYSVGGTATSVGSFTGTSTAAVTAELGSIGNLNQVITGDAVNQRSFSASPNPVALGRFLITSSPTGSTTVSSTGLHDVTGDASLGNFSGVNGLSLTTASATNYNGATSTQTANYTVGGTASSAGSFTGTFSSGVTAELGSIGNVNIGVTGDAVNQRSFSTGGTPITLGRYLIGGAPTGTVTVSSTGLHDVTGDASLGNFSNVGGLTLTTTDSTNFNGATSTQTATYVLGGTQTAGTTTGTFSSAVTAELGSIGNINIAYSSDAVNQRTFSATPNPIALGRFIAAAPTGSTTVSSTGLHDTTADASLNGFSGVNGLNLTTTDSTVFNGATSTQTAGFTVGGTAASAGSFSGTFTSTVNAELGSIAPVNVAVTGDAVNKRVVTDGATTDLGLLHSGAAVSATSSAFTTSGSHDTTTDVTVAAGSGTDGNGVTLSGGPTAFTGTTSSDTRTFGGTITNNAGGTTTGNFGLGVAGEGLAGEGTYTDVNVGYTSFVYSGQGVWNTNGGGSWGAVQLNPTNWTANGGTPGLDANFTNTDSASFGSVLSSGTGTVTLDGDNPSLNAITFNNSNASYVIAQGTGTGSITLKGNGGNATVTDLAGSHEISAPINLATSTDINVATGQQLTVSGTVSGSGALNHIGNGTTILTGSNNYAGGTSVTAGTLRLSNGSGSATGNGALNVGAGATLAGTGSSNGTGFTISGNGTTRATVLVGHDTTSDTNTTGVTTLTGSGASSIGSANLVFNLNTTVAGQGTQLAVGNTQITFNSVGSLKPQLSLNLEGNTFISAYTGYTLIAGTSTTSIDGLGFTSGQFAGLQTFVNALGQNQIKTTGVGALTLSFNDPFAAATYAPSYLFLKNTGGVDEIDVEVVPEPSTYALILGGLALLVLWQRRKSKQS